MQCQQWVWNFQSLTECTAAIPVSCLSLSWKRIPWQLLQESNRWWVVINDTRAPGADGQCQAYHYHHQLPVMRSTTTGLYGNKTRTRLFISRKEVNQIYIDYPLYPCSFLLFDNIFIKSEIMIPVEMGQRPGPTPAKTVVCVFPPFLRQGHCSGVLGGTVVVFTVQCSRLANCCYQPQSPEQWT